MQVTTLANTVSFRLKSYGNGWAYELAFKTTMDGPEEDWPAVWVQDDDATSFRQEWASLEQAYPEASQDYILRDLYGQYSPECEDA